MLASLEADRVRVAEIGAQIMELERSLAELYTEKASAQERLDSYTYPVLTLPNELIADIFLHFLPVYPLCPPLTGRLSPTLLTQICRRWREVALGTPELWRALSLSYKATPTKNEVQILHLWLNRSRSCPLSVKFYCILGEAFEALAAVGSHSKRWEHAELCLSSSHIPTFEVVGPMPLLHHLDLDILAAGISPTELFDVPLLRTVALNDNAAANITLPWTQLTSLTLAWLYPSECSPVLQQTPNLIHCRLGLSYNDHDQGQQPDIRLPHLESFVLDGRVLLDGYLETFITPALSSLTISEWIVLPDPFERVKLFISKSGCNIQKVCIMEHSWSEASYREAFPSIQFSFNEKNEDSQSEEDSASEV
ncbi:hypothetical protein DFH06DRAFT_1472092 [Mycena polygramma]|nr:hypothetical protein DFH06DRAFT_1472092 [Mycena polygramma]